MVSEGSSHNELPQSIRHTLHHFCAIAHTRVFEYLRQARMPKFQAFKVFRTRFDVGVLWRLLSNSCTRAEVLDAGHNGEQLSSITTGDGVDDLNYSPATHTLYVGAAKDAKLTIARVDDGGKLSLVAQVPTHDGARNGVVTHDGIVYLAHSHLGELAGLIVVSPTAK